MTIRFTHHPKFSLSSIIPILWTTWVSFNLPNVHKLSHFPNDWIASKVHLMSNFFRSLLHFSNSMKKVDKVLHVHPLFHFHEGIEPKAFPMFMHYSIGPIHHLCHVFNPPTFHGFIHHPIFSPTSSNWFFTIQFIS
jgi:hypothetical protein